MTADSEAAWDFEAVSVDAAAVAAIAYFAFDDFEIATVAAAAVVNAADFVVAVAWLVAFATADSTAYSCAVEEAVAAAAGWTAACCYCYLPFDAVVD